MRLDRIDKTESVLMDVISCVDNTGLEDTSISGTTVNVSEIGMRVSAGICLPVATRVGLRLDFDAHLYRLEGEVRWTNNDGEYCAGLAIDPTSPDYLAWTQMFELDL
jgi:hypothetical protein